MQQSTSAEEEMMPSAFVPWGHPQKLVEHRSIGPGLGSSKLLEIAGGGKFQFLETFSFRR